MEQIKGAPLGKLVSAKVFGICTSMIYLYLQKHQKQKKNPEKPAFLYSAQHSNKTYAKYITKEKFPCIPSSCTLMSLLLQSKIPRYVLQSH